MQTDLRVVYDRCVVMDVATLHSALGLGHDMKKCKIDLVSILRS